MIREGLSYDDVLLVPTYSKIKSRSLVDLSIKIIKNSVVFNFTHPIIPANMRDVVTNGLLCSSALRNGLSILHRFYPIKEQLNTIRLLKLMIGNIDNIGVSIGVKDEDRKNVHKFINVGVKIFCIDIAHGDSVMCQEMCKFISNYYPNVLIIAGNVATGEGAIRLWEAGADIVKVNVGSGSICTTRINTGNGVPSMTAIMDVAEAKKKWSKEKNREFYFIADGGIKNSGDIVKSLAFADMVMVGNIFAGSIETLNDKSSTVIINNEEYIRYDGSSTHKSNYIEGVKSLVKKKGKFDDILNTLLEGIRSGCSYQGVDNLIDLKDNPQLIKISNSGLRESHAHDVKVI